MTDSHMQNIQPYGNPAPADGLQDKQLGGGLHLNLPIRETAAPNARPGYYGQYTDQEGFFDWTYQIDKGATSRVSQTSQVPQMSQVPQSSYGLQEPQRLSQMQGAASQTGSQGSMQGNLQEHPMMPPMTMMDPPNSHKAMLIQNGYILPQQSYTSHREGPEHPPRGARSGYGQGYVPRVPNQGPVQNVPTAPHTHEHPAQDQHRENQINNAEFYYSVNTPKAIDRENASWYYADVEPSRVDFEENMLEMLLAPGKPSIENNGPHSQQVLLHTQQIEGREYQPGMGVDTHWYLEQRQVQQASVEEQMELDTMNPELEGAQGAADIQYQLDLQKRRIERLQQQLQLEHAKLQRKQLMLRQSWQSSGAHSSKFHMGRQTQPPRLGYVSAPEVYNRNASMSEICGSADIVQGGEMDAIGENQMVSDDRDVFGSSSPMRQEIDDGDLGAVEDGAPIDDMGGSSMGVAPMATHMRSDMTLEDEIAFESGVPIHNQDALDSFASGFVDEDVLESSLPPEDTEFVNDDILESVLEDDSAPLEGTSRAEPENADNSVKEKNPETKAVRKRRRRRRPRLTHRKVRGKGKPKPSAPGQPRQNFVIALNRIVLCDNFEAVIDRKRLCPSREYISNSKCLYNYSIEGFEDEEDSDPEEFSHAMLTVPLPHFFQSVKTDIINNEWVWLLNAVQVCVNPQMCKDFVESGEFPSFLRTIKNIRDVPMMMISLVLVRLIVGIRLFSHPQLSFLRHDILSVAFNVLSRPRRYYRDFYRCHVLNGSGPLYAMYMAVALGAATKPCYSGDAFLDAREKLMNDAHIWSYAINFQDCFMENYRGRARNLPAPLAAKYECFSMQDLAISLLVECEYHGIWAAQLDEGIYQRWSNMLEKHFTTSDTHCYEGLVLRSIVHRFSRQRPNMQATYDDIRYALDVIAILSKHTREGIEMLSADHARVAAAALKLLVTVLEMEIGPLQSARTLTSDTTTEAGLDSDESANEDEKMDGEEEEEEEHQNADENDNMEVEDNQSTQTPQQERPTRLKYEQMIAESSVYKDLLLFVLHFPFAPKVVQTCSAYIGVFERAQTLLQLVKYNFGDLLQESLILLCCERSPTLLRGALALLLGRLTVNYRFTASPDLIQCMIKALMKFVPMARTVEQRTERIWVMNRLRMLSYLLGTTDEDNDTHGVALEEARKRTFPGEDIPQLQVPSRSLFAFEDSSDEEEVMGALEMLHT